MESNVKDWKPEAEKLFFQEHKSIGAIAASTGISRQSISGHLKKLPSYRQEREWRKAANAAARKEYCRAAFYIALRRRSRRKLKYPYRYRYLRERAFEYGTLFSLPFFV